MNLLVFAILFLLGAASNVNGQNTTGLGLKNTLQHHVAGAGLLLHSSDIATVNLSPYISFRFLNQRGADASYTDAFGRTRSVQQRLDLQNQKVILNLRGWFVNPRLRYLATIWTSNSNQGQLNQVAVGGRAEYLVKDWLDIGVGVLSLPCSRSMLYNWPHWLRVDTRPIADEFFRGSYTTGLWLQGELAKGLYYRSGLGNNLSGFGIDASQLDDGFDTWSSSLWWVTNDSSRQGVIGDFEHHLKPSTFFGAAYIRSNETRESQPDTEDPENTQIRLSDGTGLFNVNAFGDSSQVTTAKYEMASVNGGIKWHGLSFDVEYYFRWISKLETIGNIPVSSLFDHGFTVQASAMVIRKILQLYATGAYINGEYGNPSEIIGGVNWFPFKSRVVRFNAELIFVDRSPVGYLAYPIFVGTNGTVGMVNLEIVF